MESPTTVSVADDVIQASAWWYAQLTSSEKNDRITTGVFSALLAFVGSIIIILVSDATPYRLTDYFLQYGSTFYLGLVGPASIAVGVLYYILARRHPSRYNDLNALIEHAKVEGRSRPEIILILPKVRQDRYNTAFSYGVLSP